MSDPATPLPILEYGLPRRAPVWRWLFRGTVALAAVLLGAGAGALVGRALTPVTWITFGMFQVRPFVSDGLTRAEEVMAAYDRDMRSHVDEMRAPESLAAVAAVLSVRGHDVPPAGDDHWLRDSLRLQFVPDSESVLVMFRSRDAALSHDVVDVVLEIAAAHPVEGLPVKVLGSPQQFVYRSPAFSAGGAIAGALAASLGLWTAYRRRATSGATA